MAIEWNRKHRPVAVCRHDRFAKAGVREIHRVNRQLGIGLEGSIVRGSESGLPLQFDWASQIGQAGRAQQVGKVFALSRYACWEDHWSGKEMFQTKGTKEGSRLKSECVFCR